MLTMSFIIVLRVVAILMSLILVLKVIAMELIELLRTWDPIMGLEPTSTATTFATATATTSATFATASSSFAFARVLVWRRGRELR